MPHCAGDTTALNEAIMDTDTAPHHDHIHLQHWWPWELAAVIGPITLDAQDLLCKVHD